MRNLELSPIESLFPGLLFLTILHLKGSVYDPAVYLPEHNQQPIYNSNPVSSKGRRPNSEQVNRKYRHYATRKTAAN